MNFEGTNTGNSAYAAPIITSNGKFYGTTYDGGMFDFGTVYEYDPELDEYTVIHHFQSYAERPGNGSLLEVESDFGMNELVSPQWYQIYPNPASAVLNIKTNLHSTDPANVRIFNLLGKKELETTIALDKGKETKLDIAVLEEGVYLLQLIVGGKANISKFVKTD